MCYFCSIKIEYVLIIKFMIMGTTLKVKTVPVTYEVTFRENVTNGSGTYIAGKPYQFRTQSPSSHPGDCFDAAYDAIHRLFHCIVRNSQVAFLPMKHDPKLLTIGGSDRNTKIAVIRIDEKSQFEVIYSSLEDLSYKIFERLLELELSPENGSVTVEWETSKIVKWDFTMAHYCFAHGRLSESDFVKIVFYAETLNEKEDAK